MFAVHVWVVFHAVGIKDDEREWFCHVLGIPSDIWELWQCEVFCYFDKVVSAVATANDL